MKYKVIYVLRKLLGLETYLFLFAILTIKRLKRYPFGDEFLHFISLIPNDGVVLDIGANIGLNTTPIAQLRPEVTVYCFEPIAHNIFTLERVIRYFKLTNTKVFKIALGDTNGELKMIVPIVSNVLMTGLSHNYEEGSETGDTKGEIITTIVRRLDDIPEIKNAEKITAIKIDVENFEYYVLKGGQALITKHMPIIYSELWNNEVRTMTMDYLTSKGYRVKIFDGSKLIDFTDEDSFVNFFFIPSGLNIPD